MQSLILDRMWWVLAWLLGASGRDGTMRHKGNEKEPHENVDNPSPQKTPFDSGVVVAIYPSALHCVDKPTTKGRNGALGLTRGEVSGVLVYPLVGLNSYKQTNIQTQGC